MAIGDILKANVSIESIRYYKSETDWGVIKVSIDSVTSGTPYATEVTCAGNMPEPVQGDQYFIVGTETENQTYGLQYQLSNMAAINTIEIKDRTGQRKFLQTLFTDRQVDSLYEALVNPFQALSEGDVESLVKVRGCGARNVNNWIKRFTDKLYLGRIYVELEEFNLTTLMIRKLIDKYKSADLVVKKVKENPYVLTELDGVGFVKADNYALQGGVKPHAVSRVQAFIEYYLDEQGRAGYSYVSAQDLMDSILGTLGEDLPDAVISDAVQSMKDKLWWDDAHEYIGLQYYRTLELNIAKEILRIRDAENTFIYNSWEDTILRLEGLQGWSYTIEQKSAIKLALDSNVCVIHGLGGSGKSSVVDAIVHILKDYSIAQAALSGRAASRMTEISGLPSSTIHKLLGFMEGEKDPNITTKDKFVFHDEMQLFQNVFVIDEVSMVDGLLFFCLLRAVKSGSKIIFLGDTGQLEPIGSCNIAYDIIQSPEIPTAHLSQIHRQAAKSAIITESRKVYDKQQIVEKDWVGIETRGELQDLVIDCFNDRSNTFFKMLQYFSEELALVSSVLDLQLIVPVKEKGQACTHNINSAAQEIYNPASPGKNELLVSYGKDYHSILREGDKVINMKNNRQTRNQKGDILPIFNGNIGIIDSIDLDSEIMIVNFVDIGSVIIPSEKSKDIELAYAITTHKMQGSQNERIIVGLDFNSYSLLSKEMVYTSISRAKKHCTIVAETSALRYATGREGVQRKLTHLQNILYSLTHPEVYKLAF